MQLDKDSALVQAGSCRNPSVLCRLLQGEFSRSQAQAASTGRRWSMPEQQDFRQPGAWNILHDGSRLCLHLPPTPQGWCQQLCLDWLEMILHLGIFASSSPEPAKCQQWYQTGQAGYHLPSTSFYSATPGHTEVMLLPDCKCGVWEVLASHLFYTFSAGLDCEWETVLCMRH